MILSLYLSMGAFLLLFILSQQHPAQAHLTALAPFIWSAFEHFVWHRNGKMIHSFTESLHTIYKMNFTTFEIKNNLCDATTDQLKTPHRHQSKHEEKSFHKKLLTFEREEICLLPRVHLFFSSLSLALVWVSFVVDWFYRLWLQTILCGSLFSKHILLHQRLRCKYS